MTRMDINQYIQWNEQAVMILQNGGGDNIKTSIELLRKTLNHLKTELMKEEDDEEEQQQVMVVPTPTNTTDTNTNCMEMMSVEDENQHQHHNGVPQMSPVTIYSVPLSAQLEQDIQNNHSMTLESNVLPFYSRAFVLSNDIITYMETEDNDENWNDYMVGCIMTVLLYNYAFVHHVELLKQPSSKSRFIHKEAIQILHMYQTAMDAAKDLLSLFVSHHPDRWNEGDGSSVVGHHDQHHYNIFDEDLHCLILAITNNMGHMHCTLGNFVETRASVFLLRDLMEYPSTRNMMMRQQHHEWDYLFFYQIVFIFLDGQSLSTSPAA